MENFFWPLGLICPLCDQVGSILSVQTAQTKHIAVTAWCKGCKQMFYETFSHTELIQMAKDADQSAYEEKKILDFYEKQMQEPE